MRLAWLRARQRGIAIWSSVWLAVVVVFISQNVIRDISFLQRVRWWNAALFEALYWLPFIAATPLFAYMASRYEIGKNDKAKKVLIHALVASAFALLQPLAAGLFTNVAAEFLFAPGDVRIAQIADSGRHAYAALVLTALWKYAVIVAVCMAVGYYRSTQDALLRSAELERQLASAQLSALKMQLHPHFLFNALHSAAMLTVVDSRRAHEVLVQLSDLLRATLDTSQVLEMPLKTELEFLDRYLAIERIRFEDRLDVRFQIAEGTERLLVPSLILQPLVENALRHGLAPKRERGSLRIRSRVVGDALEIEVQDNGVGLNGSRERPPSFGIGLSNVQERVNAANHQPTPIAIHSNGAGTTVTIRLPVRA